MRFSLLLLALIPAFASSQPAFTHPDRVRFDGHCFTIDGKDTFLFSGAFHYFRCPEALWADRFRKIKEAGFNAVETYVPWNWSERERPSGLNDFSKMNLKELDDFLTMAEDQFGLYTIVRPGPYICSEWATGGYPTWLTSFEPKGVRSGTWFRGDDPVFEAWSKHWFDAVARVVAKHQLSRKPLGSHGVILWQVENEYDYSDQPDQVKRNYVKDLIQVTKADGIDVPIFTCWTSAVRYPKGDPVLSEAFDNSNEYPRWNLAATGRDLAALHEAQPWSPKMVTEFQGGWFGSVGGKAAEEQDGIDAKQINALTLYAIQNGLTALNYYMLFGGTNFGDWAAQGITTSYDYFAPIREWGGVGDKYRAVQAIGRMLQQYGPDLARSDLAQSHFESDSPNVRIVARKSPEATYLFVRNVDRAVPASGTLGGAVSYSLDPAGMNVYRYTNDPKDGKWLVNPDPAPAAVDLPAPIRIDTAEGASLKPDDWRDSHGTPSTLGLGIWDSRFIFYRAHLPQGGTRYLWMQTRGNVAGQQGPSEEVDGGMFSPVTGTDQTWLYLNPGWPNGGREMELPHGILAAQVFSTKPQGTNISGWKAKTLADPADRSLTAVDVDTTGWADPPAYEDFPENTTMVYRTSFDMAEAPKPDLSLSIGGVDDEGWFYVNGIQVGEIHEYNVPFKTTVGQLLREGHNTIALVIHNIGGSGGLTGAVKIESPLPSGETFALEWTDRTKEGEFQSYDLNKAEELPIYAHPDLSGPAQDQTELVRSRVRFAKPPEGKDWAWEIVLDAGGDGFLTLNGQPLGRYWESGPQRAYFLPSTMLKDQNVLELTVRPGHLGDRLKAAELRPLPMTY